MELIAFSFETSGSSDKKLRDVIMLYNWLVVHNLVLVLVKSATSAGGFIQHCVKNL